MPDKFSRKTRSTIMSKIRSKNTSLETNFRKLLWKNGLGRYRIHYKLPGKPDIVYVSKKVAIFLDGDFWHGYNWKKLGKIPPKAYWQGKIQKKVFEIHAMVILLFLTLMTISFFPIFFFLRRNSARGLAIDLFIKRFISLAPFW